MINHVLFERFIFVCIMLHTLIMTIEWYQMANYVIEIITIINFIFASIYTTEAILKIIAQGNSYFIENWNKFDFLVVFLMIASIVLD